MSFFLRAALLVSLVNILTSQPIEYEKDIQPAEDMETVGSYIRVVRAAGKQPVSYHISHDDDGAGEIGYSRKKSDGGKRGYQKFDSYQKKAGDDYEFEKHDSFGLDEKGDDDGSEGGHSEKLTEADGEEEEGEKKKKAEKYTDGGDYESDGGDSGLYTTTASEAEHHGGPSGYDEDDSSNYQIPAKYEYGAGDDYNF